MNLYRTIKNSRLKKFGCQLILKKNYEPELEFFGFVTQLMLLSKNYVTLEGLNFRLIFFFVFFALNKAEEQQLTVVHIFCVERAAGGGCARREDAIRLEIGSNSLSVAVR